MVDDQEEQPIKAKNNERAALPAHKAFREKDRQTERQTEKSKMCTRLANTLNIGFCNS